MSSLSNLVNESTYSLKSFSFWLKLRAYFHSYLKYDFVPWLDFSKSYTDEKLFNMIGMKYDKSEINKILDKWIYKNL